jgi:hypothetical protein
MLGDEKFALPRGQMKFNPLTKKPTYLVTVALVIALSLLARISVSADIGPKPSLEFEFVFETVEELTIIEATLLQCSDQNCLDAEPLEEMGPQGFMCEIGNCSALAYGFSDYARLVIRFSDGVVRDSDVFKIEDFNARYRVTIRENDLGVEKLRGRINPMVGILGVALCAGAGGLLFLALMLVFIILMVQKAGERKATFQDARKLFIGFWIFMLPALGLALIFSTGAFIGLVIENVIALIYTKIRNRPRIETLTFVTLANMVTLPALWIAAFYIGGYEFYALLLIEVVIWIVETVILYILQRREIDLKEAALLSLSINGASFLIGLLLPF